MHVDQLAGFHKTEYRERRDHYAFYSVNAKLAGFDTDRESFFGVYNGMHEPEVVAQGASKNSATPARAPRRWPVCRPSAATASSTWKPCWRCSRT